MRDMIIGMSATLFVAALAAGFALWLVLAPADADEPLWITPYVSGAAMIGR